ncbi:MAG: Ig-like domain-containing protein [Candidatus Aminicenantes bacterium]|nr:Ig-like domain-containing protein [Candidatus Aminicenantes bacterium]
MSKKSLLIILFFVTLTMITQITKADVITVTTTQDNVAGSLRAAITTANTNNKDNTIILPAGVYFLSGASGDDANAGGDLDIDTGRKLTITGAGNSQTFIDGNDYDRVLHILNGTVTITDLTIRKGIAPATGGSFPGISGGGILNSAKLTLTRCVIKENTAADGTGYHYDAEPGGHGGGIFNEGTLVIDHCTITDNRAGKGAVSSSESDGGPGGHGGGIYNASTLNIYDSTISRNRAGNGGPAIPVAGNQGYGGDGGGIFNDYNVNLTMTGCTVNDNISSTGLFPSGRGGGICNRGNITMTQCTVSGNQSGTGHYGSYGGGLFTSGNSQLIGVTLVDNTAGGSICTMEVRGGGICNEGSITLKNTIVADNRVTSHGDGPDCYGALNWVSYSLIEDTGDYTIIHSQQTNILGKDPVLGPLQNNGGPTFTHALLTGSPAIDAGNSYNLSEDQRGYTRPIDIPGIANVSDGADIGAYEFNASYSIAGTVTYGGSGMPGVTLTFSNNGGSTTTDSNGHYSHTVFYNWSGAVTPTDEGYTFTPASRNYTTVTANLSDQDYTAASITPPLISLNRIQLYFGADTSGNQTGPQSFLISNSGGGILNWTAGVGANAEWLSCTPTSGTGFAEVTVTVSLAGLLPGTYTAEIIIQSLNAGNSPRTVAVQLVVKNASQGEPPFGAFDSPADGAAVSGSIAVSGWALDDVEVSYVKIYRDAVSGEESGQVYIGNAVLVEGARPDVVLAYPDAPFNYRAGWGYMLLTNLLPDQGNGTFVIYARAADKQGNTVTLGTKTITCDNAPAKKPFGAIDSPAQGGTVSGSSYLNFGWALTPLPNTIPADGSTITVWVDGLPLGHPVYNQYRQDIETLFPGLNNSSGAVGYYYLDTAKYANGVHTIAWAVSDNGGNAEGIGSRYFTIQNTELGVRNQGAGIREKRRGDSPWSPIPGSCSPVSDRYCPVRVKKGFNADIEANEIYPDEEGVTHIEIRELERVEIHLSPGTVNLSPLPVGSTLDSEGGIFYWQPGPGFIGQYHLVFVNKAEPGLMNREEVVVTIAPKFPTSPAPNRAPGPPAFQE